MQICIFRMLSIRLFGFLHFCKPHLLLRFPVLCMNLIQLCRITSQCLRHATIILRQFQLNIMAVLPQQFPNQFLILLPFPDLFHPYNIILKKRLWVSFFDLRSLNRQFLVIRLFQIIKTKQDLLRPWYLLCCPKCKPLFRKLCDPHFLLAHKSRQQSKRNHGHTI